MIELNMTPKQLADMIYESCMYKKYMVEQQNMIQEIWDNIEVEPFADPDAEEEKPVVKKKKTLTVKLDYKRT